MDGTAEEGRRPREDTDRFGKSGWGGIAGEDDSRRVKGKIDGIVEAEFEERVERRIGGGIWGGECRSHGKPGGESANVGRSGVKPGWGRRRRTKVRELGMGEEIFQGKTNGLWKGLQDRGERDAEKRMEGMMEIGKTMVVGVGCEVRGGERDDGAVTRWRRWQRRPEAAAAAA